MTEKVRLVGARGRVWTVVRVRHSGAEDADFRFWYEGLTPEQRVEAVGEALESCLKTRGGDGVPRLPKSSSSR